MSNAPQGAMSSPWGNPQELRDMISNTPYLKDTTINTQSPTVKEATKCSTINIPCSKNIPDKLKTSLNKFFINNNIDVLNISEDKLTINYEGNKLEIRLI